MTQPIRSKIAPCAAHTLFWGGAAISLAALIQRALPEATLKALPWTMLQTPSFGTRVIKGSLPASIIGLTVLASRRWTNRGSADPRDGQDVGRALGPEEAHEFVVGAIKSHRPHAAIDTPLPPFCQRTIALTPSTIAGYKRWLAGRTFWKEWQCEVAMDQYVDTLFEEIAGWTSAQAPRHLSREDENYLFGYNNQDIYDATKSYMGMSRFDENKIETLRAQKRQLEARRARDLAKLYQQFDLFDDNTPYAPLLRDALRLLMDCKSNDAVVDGEWIGGTRLVSTTRHRMFKELLDLVVQQDGYEPLAQEYGDFKRNLREDGRWPNRSDFRHMHLAQQLAKAFYSGPVFKETAQSTLNEVCQDSNGKQDLFRRAMSHGALPESLAYERRVIEQARATHGLSVLVTGPRQGAAKAQSDGFNPGSQQNISERMWMEQYVNDSNDLVQETVQLRVGTPTIGSGAITGAFNLFIDGLYADRQRLLYGSLQNSASHDESPRVQLLMELANHPRRRQAVMVLNLPMDGPVYHRQGDMRLDAFKRELSGQFTNRSTDSQGRAQVDTRTSAHGFFVPIAQLNELYGADFPWNQVVADCLQEVQTQYFSRKQKDHLLSQEEQRAFLLITYAKVLKRLRPMMNIDFAIEGCKDDQDRGAVLKLVHALDNLVIKGRHANSEDLLAVRLAFHRAAWFNKSFAVIGRGRAEYAEATARIMLSAVRTHGNLPAEHVSRVLDDVFLGDMQI